MREFKGRVVAPGAVTATALVSHGGLNILEATGADRQLQQLIQRRFGLHLQVQIMGEG